MLKREGGVEPLFFCDPQLTVAFLSMKNVTPATLLSYEIGSKEKE